MCLPGQQAQHKLVWHHPNVDGLCCCCSGVPYDMQQRNTVAEVINDGLGTNVTAKDVIVVSAMEATGVSYAVDR